MPIFGVTRETLEDEAALMSGEEDFFSVARTMPLLALMPREVTPWLTALRAYSVDGQIADGYVMVPDTMYLFAPAFRYDTVSDCRQKTGWPALPGRECGEGEGVSVGHLGPVFSPERFTMYSIEALMICVACRAVFAIDESVRVDV